MKIAVHIRRLELGFRSQNIAHLANPIIRGIEQAFAGLYFLAKQRIPHTTNFDFEPLLDFLEVLDLSAKSDIQVALNATYTSMRSIQAMLFILPEIIVIKLLNKMRKLDHFALMFDETTDCSVTEQLAIHSRYIDKESGALKSYYLKVIDVLQPEIDAL